MVDDYRTDEEQIEAIKRWWDENGRSTLLTIVVAVAAVFGWQQWQGSQLSQREAASAQYQQLLNTVNANSELTESQFATSQHLATELQQEYSNTTYAHFGAFMMARLYVQRGDLASAQQQLQWVLDNKAPDPALAALARLRLARVVFSDSGAQQALDVIDNVETGPYRAAYAELRGDLYDELGNLELAEQHYSQAKDEQGAAATAQGGNPLLELKYKSVQRRLSANGAATAAPAENSVEQASEPDLQTEES